MSELINRIQLDIQQDTYYQQNFANDGTRFLAWYLRNVLRRALHDHSRSVIRRQPKHFRSGFERRRR